MAYRNAFFPEECLFIGQALEISETETPAPGGRAYAVIRFLYTGDLKALVFFWAF